MIESVVEVMRVPMMIVGAGGFIIGFGVWLLGIRPRHELDADREREQ